MQSKDQARIGSVTKTFTATVILQLVEEGKLGLDDPVKKYISPFPRGSKITIRMLLNHTSGIAANTPNGVAQTSFEHPRRNWRLGQLTSFRDTRARLPVGAAHGYWVPPSQDVVDTFDWNFSWSASAGAMVSTLGDLRRYLPALVTGKGCRRRCSASVCTSSRRRRVSSTGFAADYGITWRDRHGPAAAAVGLRDAGRFMCLLGV